MGRSLAETFPICRDTFAEADAALGEPLSTLCFDGPADRLMLTENTQPAILAMSTAVARLVVSRGVRPAVRGGAQPRRVFGARRGRYDILRGCAAHGEAARAIHAGSGTGRRGGDGGHPGARRRRCCAGLRRSRRRTGGLTGEPQCSRTNRDCRPRRGGGARRRAREGARRQTRDSSRGERAVSLRADEAGRGSPGARAARAGLARPVVSGRRERRRGSRSAPPPMRSTRWSARCRRRCGGKTWCAA